MKHWTDQAAGRVPLTGATGYVAGRLLRKLEESGRPVRCMVARTGTPFNYLIFEGCCEGSNGLRSRAGEAHSPGPAAQASQLAQATNDLPHRGEPERGQDDETADVEIGPAQLAVEGVAVSRVTLL